MGRVTLNELTIELPNSKFTVLGTKLLLSVFFHVCSKKRKNTFFNMKKSVKMYSRTLVLSEVRKLHCSDLLAISCRFVWDLFYNLLMPICRTDLQYLQL